MLPNGLSARRLRGPLRDAARTASPRHRPAGLACQSSSCTREADSSRWASACASSVLALASNVCKPDERYQGEWDSKVDVVSAALHRTDRDCGSNRR